MFFDPTKKLSIGVESLHCPMFSVKYKIEKIGNGQGKDMEKIFHFISISFALVTQREPRLQWNMGL